MQKYGKQQESHDKTQHENITIVKIILSTNYAINKP